jgi:hypothetical protein
MLSYEYYTDLCILNLHAVCKVRARQVDVMVIKELVSKVYHRLLNGKGIRLQTVPTGGRVWALTPDGGDWEYLVIVIILLSRSW